MILINRTVLILLVIGAIKSNKLVFTRRGYPKTF